MGWKGALVEGPLWLAGSIYDRQRRNGDAGAEAPRSILVMRPNDYGDLLTTTPIFQALRGRFPSSRIVAGIGGWGRPVLAHNPFVDEILQLDVPWNNKFVADQSLPAVARFLASAPALPQTDAHAGFDIGIDVMGSHVGVALLMRLGARHRVGVRGFRGGWSACQQYIRFSMTRHVAQAALDQAALLGATDLPEARPQLFLTGEERAEARTLWAMPGIDAPLKLLVGVGGGIDEKCWPAEALRDALIALPAMLGAAGARLDVVLVGGPADRARASQVLGDGLSGVRSLAGETSLRATFALAEQADVVLTNASMLLHVAAAFRRPTVTVLGGLFPDAPGHDVLWGYPPPYASVAATGGEIWPPAARVVEDLRRSFGLSR